MLTELMNIWYVISAAVGAAVGAVIAFFLGRNWAFVAKDEQKRTQALKYFIVALGSLGLNTFGVYAFTEWAEFQYVVSKTITAIIVAVSYNYTLNKYFVFK